MPWDNGPSGGIRAASGRLGSHMWPTETANLTLMTSVPLEEAGHLPRRLDAIEGYFLLAGQKCSPQLPWILRMGGKCHRTSGQSMRDRQICQGSLRCTGGWLVLKPKGRSNDIGVLFLVVLGAQPDAKQILTVIMLQPPSTTPRGLP